MNTNPTTDPLDSHGMTIGGEPAMPILVAEYNALVRRVNEAEGRLAAALPDQPLRDRIAEAPVKQRADCTELEWTEQERARFERLYTRESVRADLAEQRADTAARDADIYQQRLERLSDGYTRERQRAEAHRLALSEALGLGTGAPWEAIHDRATELGLPPLTEDPVAQRLGLASEPADRAAALSDTERTMLTYALDQAQEHIWSRDGFTDEDQAAVTSLRRLAAEAQPELEADPQLVSEEFLQHLATAKVREDDGAEAPQPETCLNCRGSGLDPRYNGEYACPDCAASHAAEAQQPDTETRTSWTPGPVALARAVEWATKRQDVTPPAVPVQPAADGSGEETRS